MLRWQEMTRGVREVFFPPTCVGCGGVVEASEFSHVCTRCVPQVEFVREPCCYVCGHPFYGELAGERMCLHCEGLAPAFNQGRTAVLFRGWARAMIHDLKYHRALHLLDDIERVFRRSPAVLERVRGAKLVPVPLHPRKERERGFNQTRLIAEALVRAVDGGASVAPVLHRVVDTPSQTTFDRKTRRLNLKNAFALAPGAAIRSQDNYVLVDDVSTTGSTLNSCAGVLRRAGCLNLDVITFGHG